MALMVVSAASLTSSTRCLLLPSPHFLRMGTPVLTLKPPKCRAPSFATSEDNAALEATPDPPPPPPEQDKKVQAREAAKTGQTTAVVTGAIAVILGVAYLVLVQLLDSRGVILVPPPPEALEP